MTCAEFSEYAGIGNGRMKLSALKPFRKAPGGRAEEVKMRLF